MNNGKRFSVCIQNPPYDRDLHLKFTEKGFEISENMVVVEPATWLINVRDNGKAKKYKILKDKLEGNIVDIEIQNLNKEFNTGLYVPFSILTTGKKDSDKIKYTCGKHTEYVNSIYDCNKFGNYKTIKSILEKCTKYGDMMKNHITTKDMGDNIFYVRFMSIITAHGYDSKVDHVETKFGTYYGTFTTPCVHKSDNKLYTRVPKTNVGNPSTCVYGTKEELENWKYFVYNNKLPIAINILMTIDQNNNSAPYIPWLVDKKYTDEEISNILGFNKEENDLIDLLIERFELHNDYYKNLNGIND